MTMILIKLGLWVVLPGVTAYGAYQWFVAAAHAKGIRQAELDLLEQKTINEQLKDPNG